MSVEITQQGKKVTFGFRCPVCDQKWRASALDCRDVGTDHRDKPYANMLCENCGAMCGSTNFLKEEK